MNVVAEMLLTEPTPIAIWATLILLTLPAVLMLGSPDGLRHPRQTARELVRLLLEPRQQRRRQAGEAVRALRYADEVRTAADQAAAGARRWQERWEQSGEELNAAWQAWLDADARVRDALAAAAWGTPRSARTCEEYAARERHLHRAVAAAVDRGELPAPALAEVLEGHPDWDARLHPLEQDLMIARASAAWLRQRHQQTVIAERVAWHDAGLAARAATSLRDEERAAAVQALQLGGPARTGTTKRTAGRPVAVPA
ncbi:hypothetical protein [Actinoplanes sp. NPDC026619]|uniref:hypothetical protein n=1 Tax=Actinoplanes sp. NPDC026619 TaxID=3155798 RepID=UPI0033DECD31